MGGTSGTLRAMRTSVEATVRLVTRGVGTVEPGLVAAAVAYHAVFSLVSLAFGAVAVLVLLGGGPEGVERLARLARRLLPPDVAGFVVDLVVEAERLVGNTGAVLLVGALVVAMWSGSRAVYALVRGLDDLREERPWWQLRILAFATTAGTLGVGAAAAGVASWLRLGGGRDLSPWLVTGFGILATWLLLAGVLTVLYRYGPARPLVHSAPAGAVAAAGVLGLGWAFTVVVPRLGLTTVAVLGVVGSVLVWAYAVGYVVVLVPVVFDALARR